jgi:hypothetical protein
MPKLIIGMFCPVEFRRITYEMYSRATCHLQLQKFQAAVADFKKILQLEPKNDTVRAQLNATQKLVRKIEFEKARHVDIFDIHRLILAFRLSKWKERRTQSYGVRKLLRKVREAPPGPQPAH